MRLMILQWSKKDCGLCDKGWEWAQRTLDRFREAYPLAESSLTKCLLEGGYESADAANLPREWMRDAMAEYTLHDILPIYTIRLHDDADRLMVGGTWRLKDAALVMGKMRHSQ